MKQKMNKNSENINDKQTDEIVIKSQRNLHKLYKYEKICGCIFLLGAFLVIGGNVLIGSSQNFFAKFYAGIATLALTGGFFVLCLMLVAHFILLGLGFNEQIFIFRQQECLLNGGFWNGDKAIKYSRFSLVYLDIGNQIKYLTENRGVVDKFSLPAFSKNEIEIILQEFRNRSKKLQIASVLRKDYTITPDIEVEEITPAKPLMSQPENSSPSRRRNIISVNDTPSKPQNADENISQSKPKRRLEL